MRLIRAVPITTIFLISEFFLLTWPMVEGSVVNGLWRILILPAYFLILIASLAAPWEDHLWLVVTVVAVLGGTEYLLRGTGRSRRTA